MIRTTVRLSGAPPDAYRIHQAVAAMRSVPRPLWAQPAPALLVIQTTGPADWRTIPGAMSATATPVPDPAGMPAGTPVHFGLIANPARAVGKHRPDGSPSAHPGRRPLPPGERTGWLTRKLSPALNIIEATGTRLPPATGRHGITICRHLFAGAATVTDPAGLALLVSSGVGPGKAFGCGLLTIKETT